MYDINRHRQGKMGSRKRERVFYPDGAENIE